MTVTHATATLLTDRLISVTPAADVRPLEPGTQLSGTDLFLVIEANDPSPGPVLYGAALPRCRVARHGDIEPAVATSGESLFVSALAWPVWVDPDGREDLGGRQPVSAAAPVLIQRRLLATPPAG